MVGVDDVVSVLEGWEGDTRVKRRPRARRRMHRGEYGGQGGASVIPSVVLCLLTEKDGGEEEYGFGSLDVDVHSENGGEEDAAPAVRNCTH
jgi:hypothetical protein